MYEDARAIAFLDIEPMAAGHLLVIPRAHAASLADLATELGAHIFTVAHRLALALRRSALPCEGVNLFLADGEAAFQEVFHVHLHVLPRTAGDGFRLYARRARPSRDELDAVARQLRQAATALLD